MKETEFEPEDFADTARLLRSGDERVVRATLSNRINIILAALDAQAAVKAPERCD